MKLKILTIRYLVHSMGRLPFFCGLSESAIPKSSSPLNFPEVFAVNQCALMLTGLPNQIQTVCRFEKNVREFIVYKSTT